MSKYLVLRTFCDDPEAAVPDNYILELNPRVMALLERYSAFVDNLCRTHDKDTRSAYSHISSINFQWREGYWLVSGAAHGGFDPDEYFQVVEADPIAIVGEEMRGAHLTVGTNGFIMFRGFVYDPLRNVHTVSPEYNAYIFSMAVLRKALKND